MTDSVKILCCRISWMPEYRSREEPAFANMSYIDDGGTPAEALNFKACNDHLFRGYVWLKSNADGKINKIAIEKLGTSKSALEVSPVIVVFCAQSKQSGGLRIVGFYHNATVLRVAEISELPDRTSITRIISKDAVLIPECDRHVNIPCAPRAPGGFGSSSLWYGLNTEKYSLLREDVLNYVQDPTTLPESNQGVIEYRQRQRHERWEWEGKGNVRHFIHEKGFCCEACHYTISYEDQQTWGSGFELHHLQPWSDLPEGEERSLDVDDFAVLCATCHRAIHQSEYVSDVALFRKKVLAKRR